MSFLETAQVASSESTALIVHSLSPRVWVWIPQGEIKIELYSGLDQVQGVFNVVTTIETLEHIPDEEIPVVLTKLWEKLDENGCLIVSVPTLNVPLNPKHYRHYGIEELGTQTRRLFRVEKTLYVHRHSWFSAILRRMIHNRFITVEFLPWLSLTSWLYKRFLLGASSKDGAHLVALLRKS